MKTKIFILSIISFFITLNASSQDSKNLAELLGYPKDSKLLIIHADDMGLSQSTNAAVIKAFENKGITSGSIMIPCPWANDILSYAKDHPRLDIGIHLTMTSEWKFYKWGGITSSDLITSLLDSNGYFYASVEELGKTAKGTEAEKELKAQIDRAVSMGLVPTHIDTHMGSVLANPELISVYLKLSEEYNLPILFPRQYLAMLPPDFAKALGDKPYILDNLFMLEPLMVNGDWINAYRKGISELKPGLNQMIVHIATDNDEMKAVCNGHPDYGSEWRQKDLDLVLSPGFKEILKINKVILITWKQVRDVSFTPPGK